MHTQVMVFGGVNVDMVAMTPQRPGGGETVIATGFRRTSGGKGANQAVAAARAGASVALVAAVGDDDAGARELQDLQRRGVLTDAVMTVPDVATGRAMITVTPDGENSIVVVPGANSHLDSSHLQEAFTSLGTPTVLVLQTEIDAAVVDRAAGCAAGSRLVINNGPWVELAASTLRRADPLIVNEHEARAACGSTVDGLTPALLAQRVRDATGATSVLVTLGSAGVAISQRTGGHRTPAEPVHHVADTTGAGDTFVGTVAARLALGDDLVTAVEAAVSAAGRAVTWVGARPPLSGHAAPSTGR